MTDLGPILERLGLDQYLDAFVGEGFDTWETVLDIQESDLDALNVKLGHRRKLQREIANYRGIPYEHYIGSPSYDNSLEAARGVNAAHSKGQQGDRGSGAGGETKRKYRRHPKPDENAPERPPSAYVIFSNKVREDIKADNFSFTVIAKLVGDRWQNLDPVEKEPYEAQAAADKERYNIELSEYKKKDAYKEYLQYLTDFKAKHAGPAEGKKPKVESQSSRSSISGRSAEVAETHATMYGHHRVGSIGSMSSISYPNPIPSPGGVPVVYGPTTGQILGISGGRKPTTSPHTESPPASQVFREPRLQKALSAKSSTSEDSWASREQSDPLHRTSQLSIALPAARANISGLPSLEAASDGESARRSSRRTYLTSPRDTLPPMSTDPTSPYQFGTPTSTLSGVSVDDQWRSRLPEGTGRIVPDMSRTIQHPSLTMTPYGQMPHSLPLPPMAPERLPDIMQDQAQRTLPPLRLSSSHDQRRGLRNLSRGTNTPRPPSAATSTSSGGAAAGGGTMESGTRPRRDRSESEAINTLAELASVESRGESEDGCDQRQPPG